MPQEWKKHNTRRSKEICVNFYLEKARKSIQWRKMFEACSTGYILVSKYAQEKGKKESNLNGWIWG